VKRLVLLSLLLWHAPLWASPSFDLELNYADTDQAMRFSGRAASVKVGGGGLNLNVPLWGYGTFTAGYGYGYSPSESASFLSVTASGSAESDYSYFAYEKAFELTDEWQLAPFWSRKSYDLNGWLYGDFRGAELVVNAKSTITFEDIGLKVYYDFLPSVSLYAGASRLKWSLDSTATGTLATGLTASTKVSAQDSTTRFSFGVETLISTFPLQLEYSQASLNSDVQVMMRQLTASVELVRF
jgi:hypothetical protein